MAWPSLRVEEIGDRMEEARAAVVEGEKNRVAPLAANRHPLCNLRRFRDCLEMAREQLFSSLYTAAPGPGKPLESHSPFSMTS